MMSEEWGKRGPQATMQDRRGQPGSRQQQQPRGSWVKFYGWCNGEEARGRRRGEQQESLKQTGGEEGASCGSIPTWGSTADRGGKEGREVS